MAGQPTKYNSDMLAKTQAYVAGGFRDTELAEVIPTICGLAVHLEVCEDTCYEWAKHHPLFSDSLNVLRQKQKAILLNGGLDGRHVSRITTLLLNCSHGMVEKTKTDHTSSDGSMTHYSCAPEVTKQISDDLENDC